MIVTRSMPMKPVPAWVLAASLVLAFPGGPVIAEDDLSGGAYAVTYARRLLARGDTDGDGALTREEAARIRVDMARCDADGDGTLDTGELRRAPVRYLDGKGRRRLNVLYKKTSAEDLYLDVYYPVTEHALPVPIVIYTHGGGWVTGSKQNIASGALRDVAIGLLDAGFGIVAVNYRLCGGGSGIVVRDCVCDARDAVGYLARHAEALGVDATRIFVLGDSAGGQIAQMLLVTAPRGDRRGHDVDDPGYRIGAGVSWYAPCDFQRAELFRRPDTPDQVNRFGSRIVPAATVVNDEQAWYREVSPVHYLARDVPPLLLVHGDRDTTIPVGHARFMKERADAIGAPVEMMIVKNAGHNWRPVDGAIDPPTQAVVARTVDFLKIHRDRSGRTSN